MRLIVEFQSVLLFYRIRISLRARELATAHELSQQPDMPERVGSSGEGDVTSCMNRPCIPFRFRDPRPCREARASAATNTRGRCAEPITASRGRAVATQCGKLKAQGGVRPEVAVAIAGRVSSNETQTLGLDCDWRLTKR